MHCHKLLVVCAIGALLCSAIAQPTSTEQQNGDNGSILDSIASVTNDMQGEASATTANVTDALNGNLPGAGARASNMTADVSQFAGMWASAKCPVDVKSVIADSDVQKMTASCGEYHADRRPDARIQAVDESVDTREYCNSAYTDACAWTAQVLMKAVLHENS